RGPNRRDAGGQGRHHQAVEKMRGPENSKIKLKIMRKGQDKPIEISITRARIQVRSVRSRLEGDDVGFIRVTQVNEPTTKRLKKAVTDPTAQTGIVGSLVSPDFKIPKR